LELVAATRAGSNGAFEELQSRYSRRLYRRIQFITRNHEDTEDALQETFLHAYLALDSFEGRSQFASWLTRIAINSALMVLRRRRTRAEVPFEPPSGSGEPALTIDVRNAALNPEQLYDLRQRSHSALRAIGKLNVRLPFEDHSGSWDVRYYQDTAIQRVLDAVAKDKQRILLTLATGTGKTAIAFQIAWKLFQSRWNLSRKPTRRPRILFLADRNILADQAYNAFSSFTEDARKRITPGQIQVAGGAPPTNASIFFTIFQTFMSGTGPDGTPQPYFGQYPPDFFDLIIVDECHRGGANDESTWRAILDYFSPAVQLGMTATPKRRDNVDTYAYFGEPVYVYSLKEGINDGFPSVITLKPAIRYQFKTGQRDWPET
jgi:RNA polymerase sigma factor (sigma-70 family)